MKGSKTESGAAHNGRRKMEKRKAKEVMDLIREDMQAGGVTGRYDP